uniref:Uncharacterized protein n=1 Tax=Anguilla anguilla TaxID=7936 RepID=A0A0E9PJ16_ANGAN
MSLQPSLSLAKATCHRKIYLLRARTQCNNAMKTRGS